MLVQITKETQRPTLCSCSVQPDVLPKQLALGAEQTPKGPGPSSYTCHVQMWHSPGSLLAFAEARGSR